MDMDYISDAKIAAAELDNQLFEKTRDVVKKQALAILQLERIALDQEKTIGILLENINAALKELDQIHFDNWADDGGQKILSILTRGISQKPNEQEHADDESTEN